ncbi:MAG: pantoate--beta-alanine ligase, partial [Candidatus Auribacterota bacterium]|nr:pantoate--beta-alanine ligase [Candidatus Auribacterota bacterium]
DYIEIRDGKTLELTDRVGEGTLIALAVFIGKTRLIDNLVVRYLPEPGSPSK